MLEEVDVYFLWSRNCNRPWIQHLYEIYIKGPTKLDIKDFDTIAYWVSEFKKGRKTTIKLDKDYIVTDGNHRLVAAYVLGSYRLNAIICPQKSTYG
jgi:hypothetical protein